MRKNGVLLSRPDFTAMNAEAHRIENKTASGT
jgi:hypothetical protein